MRIFLIFVSLVMLVGSLPEQKIVRPEDSHALAERNRAQSACESEMLRDMRAKEVLMGPEYETFMSVVTAFGLHKAPQLYLFDGEVNTFYIAGSVFLDGRGKVLVSHAFLKIVGNTLALKGSIAHEMAHLVTNPKNGKLCTDYFLRDPDAEREMDAIAASKVGFEPLKAWLTRIGEISREGGYYSDAPDRIQTLEALEAKQKEQRN